MDTKHWIVKVSDDANQPGRCYVTLKEHQPSLSDLADEQRADFWLLVEKMEKAAKNAFGATMCNWACLMNDAFQEEPHNPHVHWHFRPRYEQPLTVAGKEFKDNEFGHHHRTLWDQKKSPKLDSTQLQEVVNRYKVALQ